MPLHTHLCRQALDSANSSKELELDAIESSLFGCTHAEVGVAIAASWHVPSHLCEIIAKHHEKNILSSLPSVEQKYLAAILLMAQNIVAQRHNMLDLPMWAEVREEVYKLLNISENKLTLDLCVGFN